MEPWVAFTRCMVTNWSGLRGWAKMCTIVPQLRIKSGFANAVDVITTMTKKWEFLITRNWISCQRPKVRLFNLFQVSTQRENLEGSKTPTQIGILVMETRSRSGSSCSTWSRHGNRWAWVLFPKSRACLHLTWNGTLTKQPWKSFCIGEHHLVQDLSEQVRWNRVLETNRSRSSQLYCLLGRYVDRTCIQTDE